MGSGREKEKGGKSHYRVVGKRTWADLNFEKSTPGVTHCNNPGKRYQLGLG